VRAQEIAAAKLVQEENLMVLTKEKEAFAVRAMNMAKLEAETLQKAIKLEEAALQEKARATVVARLKTAALEESKRLALQKKQEEIALIAQEKSNQQLSIAHTQLLIVEREAKEQIHAELSQQIELVQARIDSLHLEHLEAEKDIELEFSMRVDAERQALELARQRALSERLARQAAEEKAALHEKLKATAMSQAALDFKKNDAMKVTLSRSAASFETEQLIDRVRRSDFISKLSQGALVATLIITAGLWFAMPQLIASEHVQLAAVTVNSPAPVQEERIEMSGMKMSTELAMLDAVALNTVTLNTAAQ
jgi:hypothetical protein